MPGQQAEPPPSLCLPQEGTQLAGPAMALNVFSSLLAQSYDSDQRRLMQGSLCRLMSLLGADWKTCEASKCMMHPPACRMARPLSSRGQDAKLDEVLPEGQMCVNRAAELAPLQSRSLVQSMLGFLLSHASMHTCIHILQICIC